MSPLASYFSCGSDLACGLEREGGTASGERHGTFISSVLKNTSIDRESGASPGEANGLLSPLPLASIRGPVLLQELAAGWVGVQNEIYSAYLWPLADLIGVSQSWSVIKTDSSLNTFNWKSGSLLIPPFSLLPPPPLPPPSVSPSPRRMFSLTNNEIFKSLTFPECLCICSVHSTESLAGA